jgi:3-deoxy-D-manno-octulosonic-acid transferase
MYQIYKFLSLLFYPFIKLLLISRVKNEKEDKIRFKEKLGFTDRVRPEGKLIWFHAASIGEFNAVLPIIKEISNRYPGINILVTTVTITAAKIAECNLPKGAFHQFAPFDCYNIVKRFLAHWKPDLTIWTESEFWPNKLMQTAKISKILLINGRLSEKSYNRWKYIPFLARAILRRFSLLLTQNKESKRFIEQLGIKNAIELNNLKFVADNFSFDEKELAQLKEQIGTRPVLMAASTHPGEEAIFAKVQKALKHEKLLTIIAPRHPIRKNEVIEVLSKYKLSFVVRSSKEEIRDKTDVLLVDTLGEFGLFYRLSQIVGVGGSWCKIGHNFIEPGKLNNLIIFGPNMENSREVADLFLEQKAAIEAKTCEKIKEVVDDYIFVPEKYLPYQERAEKLVVEMNKVKEIVMDYINPFIKELY